MNRIRLLGARTVVMLLAIGCLSQFASPASAQIDLSKIIESSVPDTAPYSISAQFTPAKAGQPARLFVTAKIGEGWHVYSVTQPPGGPVRTKITLEEKQPATLAGDFRSIKPPETHPEPAFNNLPVETHAGSVTWYAPLTFAAGVDPAHVSIKGHVFIQACTDRNCLPPKSIAFTAAAGPGVPIPEQKQKSSAAQQAPATGQLQAGGGPAAASAIAIPTAAHAQVKGRIEPPAKPGQPARLLVTLTPAAGWHVYPLPTDNPPTIGMPTRLALTSTGGLQASAPRADRPPLVRPSDVEPSKQTRFYEGPVTVAVDLAVPPGTTAGKHEIAGIVGFMTCSEERCDKPEGLSFAATIDSGMTGPATVRFEPARYIDAVKAAGSAPGARATKAPAVGFDPKSVVVRGSNETASMPIWMAMLFGLAGGFILNFMPCVLPVIGLKILSFVEQSGHSRGRILMLNIWYTLGMLSVFMLLAVLAVFFEFGWGQWFTFSAFNIVLVCVLFTMSLSFLGVWEIPLPGFVGTGRANELAAQGGASGAFFKGIITTVLATPCSGPFLGSALVWSVAQPPALVFALFGCIGLGMASPYLVIGAVPSLIRLLPRPGAWMDTFKQVMGFVLLATVVYILTIVSPPIVVPTVALLFGLWGACWWIGRTLLTADFSARLRAWGQGLVFAALVAVFAFVPLEGVSRGRVSSLQEMMAGRFNRDVEGVIAAHLAAGGRSSESAGQRPAVTHGPDSLPWQPFTEARLIQLTGQGHTVLVDFTADWCPTCKTLEHVVLNTSEVRQAVDTNRVTTLLADWTSVSEEIAKMLEVLGGKQIPLLAIFPAGRPNEPIVLRGGYTQATLLKAIDEAGPSQAAAANVRSVTDAR